MDLLFCWSHESRKRNRPSFDFQQLYHLKDEGSIKRGISIIDQRWCRDHQCSKLFWFSIGHDPCSVPRSQTYPGDRTHCHGVMPLFDRIVYGDRVVRSIVCLRINFRYRFSNVKWKHRIHLLRRGMCGLWHGNCPRRPLRDEHPDGLHCLVPD